MSTAPNSRRYECGVCWTVYDPAAGDTEWQVEPGTAFDRLPEHWSCPNCAAERSQFLVLEVEERAGEENIVEERAGEDSWSRNEPATENNPATRLEAAFTRIWKSRMADLPFLNPALRVESVGFRQWEGQWLGALVTPWSVNLVLLPGEGEWETLPMGGERYVVTPAGRFRFIAGVDEELGEYHACSLFSPALEFADHETARATAEAALVALFDAANAPLADGYQPSGKGESLTKHAEVSKRDFIRGRFSGTTDGDRG